MRELTLRLEPRKGQPLYEQLFSQIVREIAEGRMQPGERLPSKRALGAHLKLSQSTVENAYAQLVAEGYVLARPRSGYFVQALPQPLGERPAPPPPEALPATPSAPEIDLSTSSVDTDIFPYRSWLRLHRETLTAQPELLARGLHQGEPELRLALSSFLYQHRNVRCSPGQLAIGPGIESLLSLLMLLLPEGSVIAAEDPGYQGIHRIAHRQRCPLIPVPADQEGMDVDALRRSGAQLAYVTPSHQFPLGLTMPIGRRLHLMRWANEAPGRYVIEDDYDSEFRHDIRPIPALQGMEGGSRVIYLGTFSRSLAPSLRIAYMALPEELLALYLRDFGRQGNSLSRFEQRTLSRFIADGHYLRHLRRAGLVYARRCAQLKQALEEIPGAKVRGDQAGLHFLLTVQGKGEAELLAGARQAGIPLKGLSEYCSLVPPIPSTLVLGYAGLKDGQVQQAAQRLRRAWGL